MTGSFAAKALSLVITILVFVDVRRSSPPKPAGRLLIIFFEKNAERQCRSHTFACFCRAFAHVDLHRVVLLLVAFAQYGYKELTSEC